MAIARRPFDGAWEVTGDAATHASYGIGPASDYKLDSGTPIKAPFGGSVSTWWSDIGGNTLRISAYTAIGYARFIAQHLREYTGNINDGICIISEHLAYSGNTGSMTTGPHLHSWVELDGVRITLERFMSLAGDGEYQLGQTVNGTLGAGGGVTPYPNEDDMALTDADVMKIWTFTLSNKGGGPGSIPGRAADWLTNMSDAVGVIGVTLNKVQVAVNGLSSQGFTPEQIKTISAAISAGLSNPTGPTALAIAKAVNDDAALRLRS